MKKIVFIIPIIIFCLFLSANIVLAQYQIEVSVPGGPSAGTETSLETYISGLYSFGLLLVGVAAVLALVIGGFMYMTSDTITSKDEAKKWIWGAISGLILGLAAYLILYTINPELIQLNVPGLTTPTAPTASTESNQPTTGVTQTRGTISYSYDANAEAYNTREKCESIGRRVCGQRFIGVIFGSDICRVMCRRP